jgi:hypothetical protein
VIPQHESGIIGIKGRIAQICAIFVQIEKASLLTDLKYHFSQACALNVDASRRCSLSVSYVSLEGLSNKSSSTSLIGVEVPQFSPFETYAFGRVWLTQQHKADARITAYIERSEKSGCDTPCQYVDAACGTRHVIERKIS